VGLQQLYQHSPKHSVSKRRKDLGSDVRRCSIKTLSKAAIKEFCFESRRISSLRERRMENSNIIRTWTRQARYVRQLRCYWGKWGSLKSYKTTICSEHDWISSTWHWMASYCLIYSLTKSQIFWKKLLSFGWRTWRKRS
jgi:hypothetical protein